MLYIGKRVHFFLDTPARVWDRDAQLFIGIGPRRPPKYGLRNDYKFMLDIAWDWLPKFHWCYGGGFWGNGLYRARYSESQCGNIYDSSAWTGRRRELHSWSWFFRFEMKRDY